MKLQESPVMNHHGEIEISYRELKMCVVDLGIK